jgi:hypothetical protein|tara:strand:- start:18849 stop:19049 length:201 start_codon:yes stop_codon:yes gene_type:complete
MTYYILTGKEDVASAELEYHFGDYDRETVEYEKEALACTHKKLRIHSVSNAQQATIDSVLVQLGIL